MRKDGDLDSLITNHLSPSQQQYNIPTGPDVFKNQLIGQFPKERKAIETYFTMVKRAHSPLSVVSFLAVKLLPLWFVNLLNFMGLSYRLSGFFALGRRSVKDIVEVLMIMSSNLTTCYFSFAKQSLTNNRELQFLLSYISSTFVLPPSRSSFSLSSTVLIHHLENGLRAKISSLHLFYFNIVHCCYRILLSYRRRIRNSVPYFASYRKVRRTGSDEGSCN